MERATTSNRFLRYDHDGRPSWGLCLDNQVFELTGTPLDEDWKAETALGSPDELTLLAPVLPSKIICVGRNYQAHAAEHGVEVPAEPLLFFKPPSALIAHGERIELPAQSEHVEHEGELGIVISRRCHNVSETNAWQFVLGLVCANDVTARDLQRKDSQWTRGKGFDTFCPVGPHLVTGLSEPEAGQLQVQCRVNGEIRQDGNTSQMAFTLGFLIAYISAIMTLEPGDLLLTGTPAGVGPLSSGDTVEVEIDKVGLLQNSVR